MAFYRRGPLTSCNLKIKVTETSQLKYLYSISKESKLCLCDKWKKQAWWASCPKTNNSLKRKCFQSSALITVSLCATVVCDCWRSDTDVAEILIYHSQNVTDDANTPHVCWVADRFIVDHLRSYKLRSSKQNLQRARILWKQIFLN